MARWAISSRKASAELYALSDIVLNELGARATLCPTQHWFAQFAAQVQIRSQVAKLAKGGGPVGFLATRDLPDAAFISLQRFSGLRALILTITGQCSACNFGRSRKRCWGCNQFARRKEKPFESTSSMVKA